MALKRKNSPVVIKKGYGSQETEERTVRRIGNETVEIRRVREPDRPAERAAKEGGAKKTPRKNERKQRRKPRPRKPQPARFADEELIVPPETERKQMLVRVRPHQTQIVVLEGPVLVEHYVAQSDRESLIGNIYVGKVRNVLPGMEAAFIDFGSSKNGVLYAGDLQTEGRSSVRIEEALSSGDEVVVQVVKDAMGAKGSRLTAEISLPGRYLVLVPDSDVHGISRRLPEEVRDRLRNMLKELRPPGFGVIVRTAAISASKDDIRSDIQKLLDRWDAIQKKKSEEGEVPRILYEEPGLLIRVIREHFTPDYRRLLIDDRSAYESVGAYLRETAPDLLPKVSHYQDKMQLFERFHVEDQLRKALDRKVWLPSGGHLIIDLAEALTVIDVNTGKFVGSSNLEETVLQNNLEAAEEIGRQLRLRDIGGIIVIDFIDMEEPKNQEAVLRRLRETLAKDKTRTQVFDVSSLGLVEMTRKNVSAGLIESFSEVCPTCNGRGVVLHEEAATQAVPVEQNGT